MKDEIMSLQAVGEKFSDPKYNMDDLQEMIRSTIHHLSLMIASIGIHGTESRKKSISSTIEFKSQAVRMLNQLCDRHIDNYWDKAHERQQQSN